LIDNQDRGSAANELTQSLLYGIFDASAANQRLRCNGLFGVNIAPLEEVHAADTVRADTAFNLNGVDGVSDSGAGVPTALTLSGGIVTAVTKNDWLDQSVKVAASPIFTGLTVAGARLNVRPVRDTSIAESIRIGRTGSDYRFHSIYQSCGSSASSYLEFRIHDGGAPPYETQNTVLTLYGATPEARISGLCRATGIVRSDTAFNLNGTDGISTTFTDGGGNTVTTSGGIVTAKAASTNVKFTPEGGLAIKLTNETGGNSVKGSVVHAGETVANSFELQSDEYDAIGVVYDDGIADGEECWVVVSGIAEVLLKDSTAATVGYWVKSADTDGRAEVTTAPSGIGAIAASEHFREIGHCLESATAGTDVLVKVVLHFN